MGSVDARVRGTAGVWSHPYAKPRVTPDTVFSGERVQEGVPASASVSVSVRVSVHAGAKRCQQSTLASHNADCWHRHHARGEPGRRFRRSPRAEVPWTVRCLSMCTAFTHGAVALITGRAAFPGSIPKRFWLIAPICSALPDLDYGLHAYGVEYHDLWGHRGMAHSVLFAAVLAVITMLVFFRAYAPLNTRRGWALLSYFFVITASHGFLDAFTDGGLGVALFSPFDAERYFMPWQPLPVPDLGLATIFTRRFATVMLGEVLMVWLPGCAVALPVWAARVARRPARQ